MVARPRPKSRLAAQFFLCAILGFLTTVFVAWSLAVLVQFSGNRLNRSYLVLDRGAVWQVNEWRCPGARKSFWWPILVLSQFPSEDHEAILSHDFPMLIRDPSEGPRPYIQDPPPVGDPYEQRAHARGFPWLALWCQMRPPKSGVGRATWEGGIPLGSPLWPFSTATMNCLPLRPIWPGLLGDAAMWAAAWAGGLFVISALRRARRRRRGLCPSCGYDLRGTTGAPCPECGASPSASAAA